MKLRSVAPQWFHDNPTKTAKCVLFKATAAYDPWFGDSEDLDSSEETDEAKAICRGTYDGRPCPLLDLCLEFAMDNNERYGVWGGMTPDERAKLRKERKLWQLKKVGDQNSQDD